MLSLPDPAAIRATLNQPLDGKLHSILRNTLASAEANGVADLTHVLIVQDGDTEEAIEQELGWSVLEHPIDGHRFGKAEFEPYWAWLQNRGGWYELILTIGNSGFAYIIVIEDSPGAPAELLRMCRTYAGAGEAG